MADVAAYAAIAATVASVGTAAYSASQQQDAAQAQADQYAQQQQLAHTKALQAEADRTRDLRPVLARQESLMGANNLDTSSPTANALRETSIEAAGRDLSNIRLSDDSAASRYTSAADAALAQGSAQAWSGIGSSVASGVRSVASAGQSAGWWGKTTTPGYLSGSTG